MRLTTLILIATLAAPVYAQAPAPQAPSAPEILDLRVNPLLDLHLWVRKLAEGKGEIPAIEGLPAAVAAARDFQKDVSFFLLWGAVESRLAEVETAAGLSAITAHLPETVPSEDGKPPVRFREGAARLLQTYAALEKPFLEKVWPQHRQTVERVAAQLRSELLPRAPQVYQDLSQHLAVPVPARPIPVYLNAVGPFPGAFTYRAPGGGAVCIVAADTAEGSQLVETAIHETLHALDVASGKESVLNDLRARLEKAGVSPKDLRDFPHTLMFVQAAGTVRRVLNPAHKDYGDVNGYYSRVPRASAVVVPAWRAYLAGEITREAALSKIVAGAGNEKGGPKATPEKPPRKGGGGGS
jgi:hypothetical protein